MASAAMELALRNPSTLFNPKSPKPSKLRAFTLRCSSATSTAVPDLAEKPWKTSDARLVLEDGSIWRAKSFGASGTQVGEVVFNTSLTGYQEIITDPSYAGQFVLMTNPHIGNTGVNFDDEESRKCFLAGLVIRSLSISTSNWRCAETIGDYLAERNIMGIYDVDTRAITRRLRQDGSLIGVLSTEQTKSDEELLEMSRSWDIVGVDLISGVSCKAPHEWVDKTHSEWAFNSSKRDGDAFHLLGLALGGKTFKMKFGHHGGNHPVRNLRTGDVEISAQNHNYAVEAASLPEGVEVTHVNLNDGSCAGLAYPARNIMSIQYHPEASPGPHDSDYGNLGISSSTER
ncbi:hypothetical protein C1H46_014511 [Malus baccata]|uniref:carbamoyl-phosphate synthase (glutamine-hydrolyzing) n=1 Tax=Malus baccata TaxID=106549 RepID=A0A540MM90_MALBA|nr:hypothetical protein C1H46_014511 [Malus baccata]